METKDANPGDKKWNNAQSEELNEGFSGENLPDDYNPAQLKPETETDKDGNTKHVERARNTEEPDRNQDGNEVLKNEKSLENRDRNYDTNPNRYPASHPDNHTNRGNLDLDKE